MSRPVKRNVYTSLNEFVDVGVAYGEANGTPANHDVIARGIRDQGGRWVGNANLEQAKRLATYGWPEGEAQALPIAQEVLAAVQNETIDQHFLLQSGVAGTPNMGAYLTGHPLCAWKPTLTTISTVGKTITVCASVSYSSSVSGEAALKRGAMLTALALALEGTGHATELWVDMSSDMGSGRFVKRTRVLVKGAHDVTDASRIAFAYGHPAMLRILGFYEWTGAGSLPSGFGSVRDPEQDLPEGTLYLPSLHTGSGSWNGKEPVKQITEYLASIGLTT